MEQLLELCRQPYDANHWPDQSYDALQSLFGAEKGRYESRASNEVQLRTPKTEVMFSAIIHASNPSSGGYGGMSFVIFPVADDRPMLAMVVGTQGLSPDEHILGKPGHSRKMNAIASWLNAQYSGDKPVAWAKRDAVRTDLRVPDNVQKTFPEYREVFERYGDVIYGFCKADDQVLDSALKALLDLHFEERGFEPLSKYKRESDQLERSYFEHLMPSVKREDITELLKKRKYVILQGPPGTGKTRLANQLLKEEYQGEGKAIQFHPNTTYENFIGGLFPVSTGSDIGFNFQVSRGHLLEAVARAQRTEEPVLLIIDEVNRADLAKVLGEAIYSLEPYEERTIDLPYDFGDPLGSSLAMPPNLHILGTMNTADRSIAILDVAIRRRFAFLNMWPQMEVVNKHGNEVTQKAFQQLLDIFVEHASEEALVLMPGHSYFIAYEGEDPAMQMQTNLIPLLREYLAQGYVTNFADAVHAYIQEIERL